MIIFSLSCPAWIKTLRQVICNMHYRIYVGMLYLCNICVQTPLITWAVLDPVMGVVITEMQGLFAVEMRAWALHLAIEMMLDAGLKHRVLHCCGIEMRASSSAKTWASSPASWLCNDAETRAWAPRRDFAVMLRYGFWAPRLSFAVMLSSLASWHCINDFYQPCVWSMGSTFDDSSSVIFRLSTKLNGGSLKR